MNSVAKSVVLYAVLLIHQSYCFWWYLGEEYSNTMNCYDTSKLRMTSYQQQECASQATRGNFRKALSKGLKSGIEECGTQFKNRRWNCATDRKYPNVFGNITTKELKESSFLYALMSASTVHGMVQACSDGDIYLCGCKNMAGELDPKPGWEWGGCSDNIDSDVVDTTKKFIDDPHRKSRKVVDKIAQHNNQAGWLTIQNNMKTVCKCQGISGSCTVKTCYRRTPTLKLVGSELMKKYTYATRVVGWVKEGAGIDWTLYNPKDIKPQASDLVYSDETNQDDFCNRNERIGSLGTVGRICNVTSTNTDNCVDLCCHRGYFTRSRPISFACNCRFEWCCEVKCDNCKKTLQEAICN